MIWTTLSKERKVGGTRIGGKDALMGKMKRAIRTCKGLGNATIHIYEAGTARRN